MIEARTTFGSPIFREIVITGCWIVWKITNNIMFVVAVVTSGIVRLFSNRSLVWFVSKPSKV
jgi:hypothetical protein